MQNKTAFSKTGWNKFAPELAEKSWKSIISHAVRVKYFVPDEHKSGGAIIEVSDKVKKISATDGTIVMADGCKIRLSDITGLSIG